MLVDYNPIDGMPQAVPKQVIVKILRGKQAKECWDSFKKYFNERNRKFKQKEEPEQNLSGISYSR